MYQYVLSFYENSISYLEKGRSKSFEASKEINMSIMHVSHFYENLEKRILKISYKWFHSRKI